MREKDKKLAARTFWIYISFLSFLLTVDVVWAVGWILLARLLTPQVSEDKVFDVFLQTSGPINLVFGFLALRWALKQNEKIFKSK